MLVISQYSSTGSIYSPLLLILQLKERVGGPVEHVPDLLDRRPRRLRQLEGSAGKQPQVLTDDGESHQKPVVDAHEYGKLKHGCGQSTDTSIPAHR